MYVCIHSYLDSLGISIPPYLRAWILRPKTPESPIKQPGPGTGWTASKRADANPQISRSRPREPEDTVGTLVLYRVLNRDPILLDSKPGGSYSGSYITCQSQDGLFCRLLVCNGILYNGYISTTKGIGFAGQGLKLKLIQARIRKLRVWAGRELRGI